MQSNAGRSTNIFFQRHIFLYQFMLVASQWSCSHFHAAAYPKFSVTGFWPLLLSPKIVHNVMRALCMATSCLSHQLMMFTSSFSLLVILDSFSSRSTYQKVSRKLHEWLDSVFVHHKCPRGPRVVTIQAQVSNRSEICIMHIVTSSLTGSPTDQFLRLWSICPALC